MNPKRHFKERYCERILGIDKSEIKQYLSQNDQEVTIKCNELFNGSEFMWQGKLSQQDEARFYLNDMTVLVADVKDENLITCYNIDFGFPEKTNKTVRDDLVELIKDAQQRLDDATKKVNVEVAVNSLDIDNIDNALAYYQTQVELLQIRRKKILDANEELYGEKRAIYKEMSKHAFQLCNSLDYKMDLMELRKV